MKVTMMKDWKKYFTVHEAEMARQMIKDCKEDECKVADYALMAARVVTGHNNPEVFNCTAEVVKNNRTDYDRWFEGSGHLDVYIRFYAFDKYFGFFDCGICLSHIWDITGDNNEEIKSLMFIHKYIREK